jgi:hypothetical protein
MGEISKGKKYMTVSVDRNLYELAKKFGVPRSLATNVGIRYLLNREGVKLESPMDLELTKTYTELNEKVRVLMSRIEVLSKRLYLQEQVSK